MINSSRFSSMNTLTLKDLPDELASSGNSLLSMVMGKDERRESDNHRHAQIGIEENLMDSWRIGADMLLAVHAEHAKGVNRETLAPGYHR
jgi:hypothetical protein